ncbi:MAG: hypothetical protein H7Z42_22895 [Roseiflexaceae bacterium]|nr:hypothetical protein [Roseiflexaceae bacterium]
MKSTWVLLLSWGLIVLGGLSLVLGSSIAIDVGTPGQSTTYSSAFCLGGLALTFGAGGIGLLLAARRARANARQEEIEAEVLRVALAKNGRVTAAEVAMSSHLSLPEAQAYLERMARSGHILTEVGEQGVLVYRVGG